jgi:hypothetical protein
MALASSQSDQNLTEQTVAHGAAGRAASQNNAVRRGPVNGAFGGFNRNMITTGDEVRELLETRWERLGYEKLLPVERDYLLIWWLEAESSNGTLHQYFYNPTGDHAPETLAALERVGAHQAHAVLVKAISAFGPSGYPTDRRERINRLKSIPDQYEVFQRLTDELFAQSVQSQDVFSLAIDRVGDAYNERGINPSDYARASKLRWPAIVLLVLLFFTAIVGVVVIIAAA